MFDSIATVVIAVSSGIVILYCLLWAVVRINKLIAYSLAFDLMYKTFVIRRKLSGAKGVLTHEDLAHLIITDFQDAAKEWEARNPEA